MKTILALCLPLLVFAACSQAVKDPNAPQVYNGQYGKSGPGKGESCYIEADSIDFRCGEAKSSDSNSIELLRKACKQLGGKHYDATCTAERFKGTCRSLRQAPGVLIRYYEKWDAVDAQIDCGETFEGLYDSQY